MDRPLVLPPLVVYSLLGRFFMYPGPDNRPRRRRGHYERAMIIEDKIRQLFLIRPLPYDTHDMNR